MKLLLSLLLAGAASFSLVTAEAFAYPYPAPVPAGSLPDYSRLSVNCGAQSVTQRCISEAGCNCDNSHVGDRPTCRRASSSIYVQCASQCTCRGKSARLARGSTPVYGRLSSILLRLHQKLMKAIRIDPGAAPNYQPPQDPPPAYEECTQIVAGQGRDRNRMQRFLSYCKNLVKGRRHSHKRSAFPKAEAEAYAEAYADAYERLLAEREAEPGAEAEPQAWYGIDHDEF